jgi:hypothetical protein
MKLVSVVIPLLMIALVSTPTSSYVFNWVDVPSMACKPNCPETHPACRRPALYDGPYVCFRDKLSRNSGDWGESASTISPMTQFGLSVAAGAVVTIISAICYCAMNSILKWKKKRGE